MKILALSDEVVDFIYSPTVKERYGDVDLIVGCGDLPFYYLEFVVTVLNKPLYMVSGNHDAHNQYMSDGRILHHAEGTTNLDGDVANQNGVLLAGLGGSIRYRPDGVHQYTQNEMKGRIIPMMPSLLLNRVRRGRFVDILITHSAPRGIHDSDDPAHLGFEAFNTFIQWFKPRFLLHGHSHVYQSNAVTRTQVGETEVLNVYPYRLVEWDTNLWK